MAITSTETAVSPRNSFSRSNQVQAFALSGATTGVGGTGTVKPAVANAQIFFKGHVYVDGATVVTFKSAAAGTVLVSLGFPCAGTQEVPLMYTQAGELLQVHSSADVTLKGTIKTLPVIGNNVPPGWQI